MLQQQIITNFFLDNTVTVGVALKNKALKKEILNALNRADKLTIPEISRVINISTPKTTALLNELLADGLIADYGKVDSTGGRRAICFGLQSKACYFIGVDVKRYYINIGLLNFTKKMVSIQEKITYPLENTQQSLEALIAIIKKFISDHKFAKNKIISIGINLSGRVNNITGYSYSYFHFQEEPLAAIIEKALGIKTYLENDSNAMAYGEYQQGVVTNQSNVLFINLDYGTGSGIIINGAVYYGKSGFSGELGHIPFYDNNIICGCGKKGCFETEVSGEALVRLVQEKLAQGATSQLLKKNRKISEVNLEQIIDAAKHEDMLVINLLAEMGDKLGKGLSVLINIFNPELVILGGVLAKTGNYIKLPVKSGLNKYSLSLVNNDTEVTVSKLLDKAGVVGASLIARNKVVGF